MTDGEAAGSAAFEVLGADLRAALSERGFDRPTRPQRIAIEPIAAGEHALVVAPTGSGKTETAMLPVFDALLSDRPAGIGALYVTPLRALNRDMRERLEWWGEHLDLEVDVRHGDTTDYRRRQQAVDPPDVLVTTPETLQAMLTGERLREGLSDVAHVVVDEIHELAVSKRGAQLSIALERIRELAGEFQRVGLSATVGDPGEVGRFLTGDRGCAVRTVDVGGQLDLDVVRPRIRDEDRQLAAELATDADTASHVRVVRDLVRENESTLVFVNTRQTAEALGSRVRALDLPIGVHHGSLSKAARIDAEDRFKAGDLDGLICTSSMELGIDVGRVDHVVQHHSPRQVTRLLQRVGRAGHREDRRPSGTVLSTRPDDTLEAAAIARRARAGEVEPAAIHEGSLDVVANQVPGMVVGGGAIDAMRAYRIVTRAYPFRDLAQAAFRDVLRELSGNRVVWVDEENDRIEPSGGTRQYVYANLSMIPDEETYTVEDVASGQPVGTLDRQFVASFADRGATFVQRGELWRVVELDEDDERVQVTPVEDPGGEVPSWVGQEIPVPQAVASEVGEIRRVAGAQFEAGADAAAVARDLAGRYPADADALGRALEPVAEQVQAGDPLPTDRRIVVEGAAETVVVGAALGHRGNETVGRVVASLVGQRTGSSVGLDVDPYRIEFDVPPGIAPSEVADVLYETDPDHVRAIIELSLKRSDALLVRLSQVARSFGALREGSSFGGQRLRAALEDTPVYDEAVREVFHEDLDVAAAGAVLRAIQSDASGDGDDRAGDGTEPRDGATDRAGIEVAVVGGRTAVGRGGRSSGRDLLAPEGADRDVVETVRDRIADERVRLVCLHCDDWERRTRVRRVPDQPECPGCGATRIAALHPAADEVVAAVHATDKNEDQHERTQRAHRNASLVQAHGKQAVIALRGRGVGPDTAARIINEHHETEVGFYRAILERERQYARTRSFWD